jgi:GAF domain-containing protein
MVYPVPDNEDDRLRVLRGLSLIHTGYDPAFDDLCFEAAHLFAVPIALITLVDATEQRFKARCGLDIDGTPRDMAFCAHAIMTDDVMLVPDARLDPRFASNPLVTGAPGIVFYAGAPLLYGEGIRLGTICIIDTKPRNLSDTEMSLLVALADRVSGEIWARSFREVELVDAR